MKKTTFFIIFIVLTLFLSSDTSIDQQQYEVMVTNIMVPLRVFDGDQFVNDLNMADFEVYEDGQIQTVKAVYLTRNGQIERMDADRDYRPRIY